MDRKADFPGQTESGAIRDLRTALENARKPGRSHRLNEAAKTNVDIVRASIRYDRNVEDCLVQVTTTFAVVADAPSNAYALQQAEFAIDALKRALESAEPSEEAAKLGIPFPP